MAKRRKKKQRTNVSAYFFVFLATCIVGYLAYNLISNSVKRSAEIVAGQVGSQHTMSAVIVRNEKLTDTEGLTSVKYHANEGELVYKGQRIAEVYSSGYSQTDANKLFSARTSIKTQLKTLLAAGYADAALDDYDKITLDYARELRLLISGKAEGNLLNLERQLSTSLGYRQTYLKNKYYESDPALAGYYDTEATLDKKIQSWTTTFLAEQDCIVSFYTDGWENVFDIANFDDIPLEQPAGVLSGGSPPQTTSQRGRSPVFRAVNPSGWYMLLVNTDKNWSPVQGQTYKVQLRGIDNYVMDAYCSTVSIFGAEQLIRMRVTSDVRPVLNMRATMATLSDQHVAGLKVPSAALIEQDGQTGVVLLDGQWFVPVTVVSSDGEYAIVISLVDGKLYEGQRIRVF